MRSSGTSTRLTPLKLKSSSTRYVAGSAETCRTIVASASWTFWLNATPWIVSPLRFTLTRWCGSNTPEPPEEDFHLTGLARPVGDLDGERAEPVERRGAQERSERGRVFGSTLQRLAHLVRVAVGALRQLLEDPGGEVVKLLGELGRPGDRLHLGIDRRRLWVARDRRGAQGRVAEHPERRGERLLGGGIQGLRHEPPRGEQDEGERDQCAHALIDPRSRAVVKCAA